MDGPMGFQNDGLIMNGGVNRLYIGALSVRSGRIIIFLYRCAQTIFYTGLRVDQSVIERISRGLPSIAVPQTGMRTGTAIHLRSDNVSDELPTQAHSARQATKRIQADQKLSEEQGLRGPRRRDTFTYLYKCDGADRFCPGEKPRPHLV